MHRDLAIGVVLSCLALTGCNDAAPATGPPSPNVPVPGVSDCGTKPPKAEPREIILTCADGGEFVKSVDWVYWGQTSAVGEATVSVNDCDPFCYQGTYINYPAVVLLDRVQTNGSGPQFSHMVVSYQDKGPTARKIEDWPLYLYDPSNP